MIDPVVRCPGCGITVWTSSDSVSNYCAVCEPRYLKGNKRKRGGGNSRRGRAARRNKEVG